MPNKRRKTRRKYTPLKRTTSRKHTARRNQGFRKNPALISLIIILAMLAIFYFGRDDGLFFGELNISGDFAVHFIDIGQGDAILIQNSYNEFMLIDTGDGRQWTKLSSYLERFGVRELKYVVLSHPHADHIGSAHRIVREYSIGTLIMPPVTNNTQVFRNLLDAMDERNLAPTRPEPGAVFQFGDAEFKIIAPLYEGYANINNYSVVILMQHGSNRFLFTGDMERQSENEIINRGLDIRADVLAVAHHGSATSSQASFLNLIRPSLAVIQVAEGNQFNHPNMQVVGRLEDVGADILRNDWHGDIIIISDGHDLTVHTSAGNYSGRFAAAH